jgi:sialate O-acetylesterase
VDARTFRAGAGYAGSGPIRNFWMKTMPGERFTLKNLFFAVLLSSFAHGVSADIRLPRLLSDGLILQRDMATNLWGWADDGETVRVFLDGELAGTTATDQGRWQLKLPAQAAGGPHRLKFEGANTLAVEDVWFGDIWIASGQSNMEMPMQRVQDHYADEIAAADLPLVRQFKVPKAYDFEYPHEDVGGEGWVASTPETVGEFSALAWFFARDLQGHLGVPIGIINSSFGGSPAEGWLSEQELEAWPEYLDIAKRYREEGYLAGLRAADEAEANAWYQNLDRTDSGLNADPGWSSIELDDADWPLMNVPGNWADTDLGPVHGAVWFRKSIDIPAAVEGRAALLKLGRIVDADTTWVNGVKVGATTYQYPPRRYEIPAGVLRTGVNTIVVRIVNVGGGGGFVTDKPYWLKSGEQIFNLQGAWRYRLGAAAEAIPPMRFQEWSQPLGYYNAMLAPLQKMTIKGVIWYQGESNVDRAAEYKRLFPYMIRAWRRQWGQGDFPFLFVQLANFLEAGEVPTESEWAELRDAQKATLSEPATAMAVAIDVGEWNDIHPLNKQAVGERLALAARKVAYGQTGLVYSGPMLASVEAKAGALMLRFDHAGSGLEARSGPLQGFALAGSDGRYAWAQAEIQDDKVVVRSSDVPDPVWVRYAWADNPAGANLYNREGLPASPFQARREP